MRCSATTRDRVGLLDARVPFQHLGHGLTPYPYVLDFAQDAHERLLIEQLDALGVKVERRTELSRFEQQRGSVQATLRRADGSEDLCETTYLAGCDGVRSTVREGLGIGFPGGTYDQLSTSPTWKRPARRPMAKCTSTSGLYRRPARTIAQARSVQVQQAPSWRSSAMGADRAER